jgi:glycosyltransferase involved in cell wall biosynthesis
MIVPKKLLYPLRVLAYSLPFAKIGSGNIHRVTIPEIFRMVQRKFFDRAYYLRENPDIRASGMIPLQHYLEYGGFEGRNPSSIFNSAFYLENNPDIRESGINPLLHYIRYGQTESRLGIPEAAQHHKVPDTSTTIDSRDYQLVQESGLFDKHYYYNMYQDIWNEDVDPILHYLLHGWKEGRNPSRHFDTKYYIKTYWENDASGHNPLIHFILEGQEKGNYPTQKEALKNTPPNTTSVHFSQYRSTLPKSNTILFIGHDALLAGAQVVLLNVVRWFHQHTSIEIKIILLNGGPLMDQFAQYGSTWIWQDVLLDYPTSSDRRQFLTTHFSDVALIYGNTVLAASIYDEFSFLEVPFVSHIHELEQSIKLYADPNTIATLHQFTQKFIACSDAVATNLTINHGAAQADIATIYAFISNKTLDRNIPKNTLRKRLALVEDAVVVIGCGTIYWRKGVDLFMETALALRSKTTATIQFYWIGENFWSLDTPSTDLISWEDLTAKIERHNLAVSFLGTQANVQDYFLASDIFFLPSREDPFPLVCLEAAQCGIPVVCFEKAGGMPDFVADDAGIVVPYLDIAAAAEAINTLANDANLRKNLGENARIKLEQRHLEDIAMPEILKTCHALMHSKPVVSIIIPVFNHAKFLEARINSILQQTFKDVEIIILDDASLDNSEQVAAQWTNHPQVRIIRNEENSGSAFKQWKKGLETACGEYVWIAEGDDACKPEFLSTLLPFFQDNEVVLAYSNTVTVDEEGQPTDTFQAYLEQLDFNHWKMDYVVSGDMEINFGLGVKNSIPNVSAVLFRRSALTPERMESTENFRFSGDWFLYVQLIKDKKIAYSCLPLNEHRKHGASLTHQFNHEEEKQRLLLDEAYVIHCYILKNYYLTSLFPEKLRAYLEAQIVAFFPIVSNTAFDQYYPYTSTLAAAQAAVDNTLARVHKVVFITTNDYSHDGGSEQLWIQTAIAMGKKGHHVMAVIQQWSPEPYFFEVFRENGVDIVFKNDDTLEKILSHSPDLVVVNIGDQDEGTEWYAFCQSNQLPYSIVNQLTKEPEYSPIKPALQEAVKSGYLAARAVFFTSRNNRILMEKRLECAIPNADLIYNPFYANPSTHLPGLSNHQQVRFAMPARMSNIHKGQNIAIAVFAQEKWQNRPVELHLYGEGPDERLSRATVKQHNLQNVFFHNPNWQLPKPNMESIWRENHALLMTSFMEGMPLVLLNAMCYGRVPIVTDVGGHREIIDDNVHGFIAWEPTVEAVDEALERAWQQLDQWNDIGILARKRMLAFMPKDPVQHFVDLLNIHLHA